jgi:DNA-binding transcriptional LysR family regulator
MTDLHQIRTFLTVAEKRSFSQAAEELLLTQPTVSAHIRDLEAELGVRLFDRLPRSSELTPAGRIFLRHAERLLQLHREAFGAVREFSGRIDGPLVLGGSTIPGEYLLPDLISRFKALHPAVAATLTVADSRLAAELVAEGRLDLALVGDRPEAEALDALPFRRDSLVLILHPGNPLALHHPEEIPWEEARRQSFWEREEGSASRGAFQRALVLAGHHPREISVLGELGSNEAVKQAVRAGNGVAVVSSLSLESDLASGRLAARRIGGLDLDRVIHLIRHRQRTPSPAAAAFLAFAVGEADPSLRPPP